MDLPLRQSDVGCSPTSGDNQSQHHTIRNPWSSNRTTMATETRPRHQVEQAENQILLHVLQGELQQKVPSHSMRREGKICPTEARRYTTPRGSQDQRYGNQHHG